MDLNNVENVEEASANNEFEENLETDSICLLPKRQRTKEDFYEFCCIVLAYENYIDPLEVIVDIIKYQPVIGHCADDEGTLKDLFYIFAGDEYCTEICKYVYEQFGTEKARELFKIYNIPEKFHAFENRVATDNDNFVPNNHNESEEGVSALDYTSNPTAKVKDEELKNTILKSKSTCPEIPSTDNNILDVPSNARHATALKSRKCLDFNFDLPLDLSKKGRKYLEGNKENTDMNINY